MREKQMIEQDLVCSFCNSTERDVDFLVEGDGVYICDVCVWCLSDVGVMHPPVLCTDAEIKYTYTWMGNQVYTCILEWGMWGSGTYQKKWEGGVQILEKL